MFFSKKEKPAPKRGKKATQEENDRVVREYRDKAARFVEKGKYEAALDAYREIIRIEPTGADWQRKIADCYHRLERPKDEMAARCRAATLYAEEGHLLKGVAMCKMALALEPDHLETQRKLAELNAKTGQPISPGARPPPTPAAKPPEKTPPQAPQEAAPTAPAPEPRSESREKQPRSATRSIPPGASLESVELSSIMPPAAGRPPSVPPSSEGTGELDDAFVVPLDDEILFGDLEDVDETESEEIADGSKQELTDALNRTPLLSDLNEASFVRLVERVEFRELSPGEVLFNEGDLADAMYVVVEGEVIAWTSEPQEVELARLKEGDFFGEIGLLTDQPRLASITAASPTILLRFETDLVSEMEESEPEFIKILLRFVRERLVGSLVATSPFFAPFAGANQRDLTRRFKFLDVPPGTSLVKQSQASEGVFILLTGSAIVEHKEGTLVRQLGTLSSGDVFGEMSLINQEKAVASVVTKTKSFVLQLPANDFTQIVMMHPAVLDYISRLVSDREAMNANVLQGAGDCQDERLSLI